MESGTNHHEITRSLHSVCSFATGTRGHKKERTMKTRINSLNPFKKSLAAFLIPILAAGTLATNVYADKPVARVHGVGVATMIATADDVFFGAFEEGQEFDDNHFKIKATKREDGSVSGAANFVFGIDFAELWGADLVTLDCEVSDIVVLEDGTVVLSGISHELDYFEGEVIFEEYTDFEIIVDPTGATTLRWCALPAFDLVLTRGRIKAQ